MPSASRTIVIPISRTPIESREQQLGRWVTLSLCSREHTPEAERARAACLKLIEVMAEQPDRVERMLTSTPPSSTCCPRPN